MDQELADTAADAVCALARQQHFSVWNEIMAAILKLWQHIRNATNSINAQLFDKHSCRISSWSNLKWWWSLRLSLKTVAQQVSSARKQTTKHEQRYGISSWYKNSNPAACHKYTVIAVMFVQSDNTYEYSLYTVSFLFTLWISELSLKYWNSRQKAQHYFKTE